PVTRPYDTITLEQVAAFPRPGTVAPAAIRFTPDGSGITYLFSAEGSLVRSLWRYDIATGERTVIAGPPPASTSEQQISREEELRRERARLRELGVTSYEFATRASQRVLLVPSGEGLSVAAGERSLTMLPGTAGAIDPHLSPDGASVAYVRDGELYVVPVSGGEPRRLTHDAEEGITNGLAEFIAQEELDRSRGFWWSPDCTRIAFIRADSRHIAEYPIVHQGLSGVEVEQHRYPFAGDANAHLRVGSIEVASGDVNWLPLTLAPDDYIAHVAWRPDNVLTVQTLSRDQRTLRLVAFPGGEEITLIEEHGEPWINLDEGPRFLSPGEILLTSERTGFRHLYLHDAGAGLRTLTSGDWIVTSIARVDEAGRRVFFHGTRESVLERHLYAVSLDGGEVTRLTQEEGWHNAVVSPDGSRFLDAWSSLGQAPVFSLVTVDGGEKQHFFGGEISAASLGLDAPELVQFPLDDGTVLHGAIYAPPDREPGKRYPVIVSVYGGPHAQRVANEWSGTIDLRAQYLARQGYVVFKLDNRGSANRGLAFEAALADNMGSVEVEDQVAGVRFLDSLGYADTSRVGIYGWSYGGYMTCMALFRRPDVFSVGVAGAPVADWDGYDTGYTERYMRTPQTNPDGYRESSVLKHAHRLEGKLMLVHGGIDENVHFRHTARIVVALTEAQKEYDLVLFPEERHMPRDAKGLEYMERRLASYFDRNL
ncbi:hypothetical protein AYO38_10190, partial [bacterium SCGC AG-212-C10]